MPITALNILTQDEGKEYLKKVTGVVIEGVTKAMASTGMKNVELSGDPTAGSVEAKRFVNAVSNEYGTARKAGAGSAVKAKPVVVRVDKDREIVEEVETKDTRLYGVEGLIDRRSANHVIRMVSELDGEFFSVAHENAVEIEMPADLAIEDELEALIQECENAKNDFVDGVPRAMMRLVCSTEYYGKIRNNLDKCTRTNVDTSTEEFYAWHGVDTRSSVHLPTGCRYILMVQGAVAQPIHADQYVAEKIPLSNAYGLSLFYYFGTETVMPDLIFTNAAD